MLGCARGKIRVGELTCVVIAEGREGARGRDSRRGRQVLLTVGVGCAELRHPGCPRSCDTSGDAIRHSPAGWLDDSGMRSLVGSVGR